MNLLLMRWELAVAVLIIGLFLIDLFIPKVSKHAIGLIAALGLSIFLFGSFYFGSGLPVDQLRMEGAYGFYVLDSLAVWVKRFSMLATLFTILMSLRFWDKKEGHLAEYILLQLIGCLAMMLVGSTMDFLSLFVSLELLTVTFYVLVGFQHRKILSLEAGLKYLIYGALSSGILLYGIVLICGVSEEIQFVKIAEYARIHLDSQLLFIGLILVLVGIAFKISAVPFHWWTPDVYEGAPTPTVALLTTGSKAAGFILLIRILLFAFPSYQPQWFPLVCAASGASILWGNFGALSQTNLKRLMGYSSISHTGYMLLGIAACSAIGLSAILYYLLGYLFANALIFWVMCETSIDNPHQHIRSYAGLGTRSRWAAGAITLGLLSLAGIPPLAGFFGKLLLFYAAITQNQQSLYILLVVAVVGVVCSLYYYLGVLRIIYFSNESQAHRSLCISPLARWILGLSMISVVIIGFYQSPWWGASLATIGDLLEVTILD